MQSLANVALWALALLGTIQSGQARPTSKPYNVLTWEEAYAKAENLLSQMTLEQKVNLTTGTGNENGPCEGNTAPVENPHFPALCLNDGPIGLREARNISVFVAGINACASFDRNLIRQRAEYMGAEFHDKGVNVLLGPGMNLMRSPRGGRNWEFGSEDPYLLGIVSAETITGIQSSGVMATAKHFIGNEQELNRSTSSTDMDDRTLHEIYLWPFARSVEAGVTAVMCAYNKVNGTYACEDDYTLNHVLKGELDFKGFVMSDWWATHSTATSANHGMDMSMPGDANDQSITGGGLWYGKNLTDAVKEGKVDESRVHDMALRIAASWYKVGQDKDYPPLNFNYFEPSVGEDLDVQRNHKENIRAMGRDSLILLRNENNILPLKEDSLKKLAIIGSDAGPDPNGLNACPANSCDNGTLAQGWGSGTAMYPYLVTPIDGIKARAPESWEIISTLDDRDLDKAAQVAAEGDIAMVFANSDSGEQYITVAGNVGDRNNVSLWNNGDNLIKAVADANENTIVVIHSVGTIDMPWLDHPNIKALVWPGLPGQETGNSLADVLFGDYAPGGKLPYTIAPEKDFPAEPSPEDHVVYKEKLLIGYRWFDAKNITPQFEFGFGLSYTTFEIDNLKLKSSGKGDKIKVSATVTVENTGDMEGSEVVQAYISFPESAGEPPKVLRGFEKVLLKPGKKTKVKFEFTKTELSIWDTVKQSWVVPSGEFKLLVGASSRDIRQTATFTV